MNDVKLAYGIEMINAPTLWNQGYTGDNIVVAVLDTGCDYNNIAFKKNIIGGYNFTSDYTNDTTNYYDNNGHGTHVAGIIGSKIIKEYGVGIAKNAKLLILKTLTKYGKGSCQNVIDAIKYCISWTGSNHEKVRIISMSLGVQYDNLELHNVIKEATKNNIIIVCSAGNMGDGNFKTIEEQYPAMYKEVIQVGAVDNNYKFASFSNTNSEIDIVAPGVKITSTFLENTYATFSGTSMAVPHVTGAITLLISKYENYYKRTLSRLEILNLLYKHAKPINYKDSDLVYRFIDLSL